MDRKQYVRPAGLDQAQARLHLELEAGRRGVEGPTDVRRYVPATPTPKQAQFLALDCREAMFGGAAGGGKSQGLLMAALQYVQVPSYAAIVFRRTFADLALPGALMDRAAEWLGGTDARWSAERKTWTFPSGATLSFGYLENAGDEERYKSAEFCFIGFDELTTFPERPYRYLFSRLRKPAGMEVPLRMRAASNPGGVGHDWVRQRFLVEGPAHGRVFVPAKLDDNPFLDRESYLESLGELDPIDLQQLLAGDWSARRSGGRFQREWFTVVEPAPVGAVWVRRWDLAATEPKPGKDPDYTVGALVGEHEGIFYIGDIVRMRGTPIDVERTVRATAERDGIGVLVRMEQEPGSAGVTVIDHYAREVLRGYAFEGVRSTGSKEVRATVFSAAAGRGNVRLLPGDWHTALLDELELFPLGEHDDQVDAVSGAMQDLVNGAVGSFAGMPYADLSRRPASLGGGQVWRDGHGGLRDEDAGLPREWKTGF
jgi:predicted phage terminase large subunit-like protein